MIYAKMIFFTLLSSEDAIIPKYGKMHVAKNSADVTVATVSLQKRIRKILVKLVSNGPAISVLLCYKPSFFGHFVQNGSKYFGH